MSLRSLTALSSALLSSLLLFIALVFYARFIEPQWVQETHWNLTAEHWKGRPLKLVVLADLHAKSGDGAYLDALVQQTLAAKPDAVLLLGDYINEQRLGDSMDAETLGKHLAPLAQLPCFAVLGNHDYDYGEKRLCAMLRGFGANVLDGKVQALTIGGDTLYLAGMRCLCTFDTPGDMELLPEETRATTLLLTHSPAGAHVAPDGITAILAAHTHGGQVCLPGGTAILRPDRRVRWQDMQGEVNVGGKPMYVSRGLGTSMMPVRLFCRPELLVVELRGKRVLG